ncbi:hypothetical protein MKZ38_007076 [Zalerion maritima]|uniref:Uncharacterized protein n=1 Tax=Zalerion maritima TaxID=339359 RepID=A0AAD5WN47_9PEZI|nr:hypothetical protein MKZ38_007076 [Zalerion maritima]
MALAAQRFSASSGPGTKAYTASLLQNPESLSRLRRAVVPKPQRRPLTKEDLLECERQGDARKPLRPNHSDNYKVNLARCQMLWEDFVGLCGKEEDWRDVIKGLSWETKGVIEAFEVPGPRNRYGYATRACGAGYARELTAAEIPLRREPAHKNSLLPGTFLYLQYFRWVRDRSAFNIGLDRIDDSTIRLFQMYAGARTHELVYEPMQDNDRLKGRYRDNRDAYSDLTPAGHAQPRGKDCWVCEGVIEKSGEGGFDRAEKLFNTKLNLPAVKVTWKREFWHTPVFRRTDKCGGEVHVYKVGNESRRGRGQVRGMG